MSEQGKKEEGDGAVRIQLPGSDNKYSKYKIENQEENRNFQPKREG